jgi:hypothetical protein
MLVTTSAMNLKMGNISVKEGSNSEALANERQRGMKRMVGEQKSKRP